MTMGAGTICGDDDGAVDGLQQTALTDVRHALSTPHFGYAPIHCLWRLLPLRGGRQMGQNKTLEDLAPNGGVGNQSLEVTEWVVGDAELGTTELKWWMGWRKWTGNNGLARTGRGCGRTPLRGACSSRWTCPRSGRRGQPRKDYIRG